MGDPATRFDDQGRPVGLTIQVRVRYSECDPMNVAHHSVYPIWMEIARTDLLRATGMTYREMEAEGWLFVVARLNIRYKKPAYYDDVLKIDCEYQPTGGIKLEHVYRIERGNDLLVEASTTLVCVDRDGRPQKLPPQLPL